MSKATDSDWLVMSGHTNLISLAHSPNSADSLPEKQSDLFAV